MDENSLHYWIIPIICIVSMMGVFVFAIDYKVNTIAPNAELEIQEINEMACPEILLKDAANNYWTSENAKVGNAKALGCNPPKESQSTGMSPYVEFCTPGGFAPVKKIGNSTHSFDHDACVWNLK